MDVGNEIDASNKVIKQTYTRIEAAITKHEKKMKGNLKLFYTTIRKQRIKQEKLIDENPVLCRVKDVIDKVIAAKRDCAFTIGAYEGRELDEVLMGNFGDLTPLQQLLHDVLKKQRVYLVPCNYNEYWSSALQCSASNISGVTHNELVFDFFIPVYEQEFNPCYALVMDEDDFNEGVDGITSGYKEVGNKNAGSITHNGNDDNPRAVMNYLNKSQWTFYKK